MRMWVRVKKGGKKKRNGVEDILAGVLPYGQAPPWGKEMKMTREIKRSQPCLPEIKVLLQVFFPVPPRVFPGCSPRPADSMLQSGTLFTFWTQLTSPSPGPSVAPSPSCLSLSLSLSPWHTHIFVASGYSRAIQGVPLVVVSSILCRGQRHCSEWLRDFFVSFSPSLKHTLRLVSMSCEYFT